MYLYIEISVDLPDRDSRLVPLGCKMGEQLSKVLEYSSCSSNSYGNLVIYEYRYSTGAIGSGNGIPFFQMQS